jgi:succinate-semialdehyde dehydrogenase/glutarate-semialdehyde dehydrogenase
MSFQSINPYNSSILKTYDTWERTQLNEALEETSHVTPQWSETPLAERCQLMTRVGEILRKKNEDLARLITVEMGKLIGESRAEVSKCALLCDYYAENAHNFLHDELVATEASKSFIMYQPLGTVLAIMPWNFPLWQVLRFAVPALIGGNTGLLKHASNVMQCALKIEEVFQEAGFPRGVFRTLMIKAGQVKDVIEDSRVHAVTLTGSENAGRKVAALAGAHLKKTVLELGGSDAFIILKDADMEKVVTQAVASRFLNTGQSCIAAKRFIVVKEIADEFVRRFKIAVEALKPGDPLDESTTLAPMARRDLRDELHEQVTSSISEGAVPVTGCLPLEGQGAFYHPSILDHVKPPIRAYSEELFGPVAIVIRAHDEEEAITRANDSRFGLGGSVWTSDSIKGEQVARKVMSGLCYVNTMVKSDPRLPFGGIKASGYGRELSYQGLREFLNIKSVWVK